MVTVPKFENTWSVGNILTLISMVLLAIGLYTRTMVQFEAMNQRVLSNASVIQEVRLEAAQHEARIRALELGVGRIEEKLAAITAATLRIEQAINDNGGR